MRKKITFEEIFKALTKVGLNCGDIVYLQCDLSRPGMVEGIRTRDEFCRSYLNAIQEIIGIEGTLVVPTYTTQVARFDMDFVWEETPTVLGLFPEYIRKHPNSLRSLHPLHSFCALGFKQEEICANNSANDFGWGSPFDRMHKMNTKMLTIGLESGYVVGNIHYMETYYAVPYQYNKLLKWRPIVSGKPIERQFFSSVRHLNLAIMHDLSRIVQCVHDNQGIASATLGSSNVYLSNCCHVFNVGMALLMEDPFAFLAKPPLFEYGVIPFDGPTAGRDGIDEHRETTTQTINWPGYYLGNRTEIGSHILR